MPGTISSRFKQIGIVYQNKNEETVQSVKRLIQFLSARNISYRESVITSRADFSDLDLKKAAVLKDCDLIIVLGGDGSMLAAVRALAAFEIPLLCINLGRLGFLADISSSEMETVLEKIFAGELREEQRLMLNLEIIRNGKVITTQIAFNEVVVLKSEVMRMIEFETIVDGHSVSQQRGDGTIISTPTGSTAYSLSSGGPIVYPSMEAILLVPISPHAMGIRPLVIPSSSCVEIKLIPGRVDEARVSYDGQGILTLLPDDLVRITTSPHKVKLIQPADYDYFELLRAKLHWGK